MKSKHPSAGEWTDIDPQSPIRVTFGKAKNQTWDEAQEEINFIKTKVMNRIGDDKSDMELLIAYNTSCSAAFCNNSGLKTDSVMQGEEWKKV
eukprot:6932771-Ditylum_brightwellii.AAC.1